MSRMESKNVVDLVPADAGKIRGNANISSSVRGLLDLAFYLMPSRDFKSLNTETLVALVSTSAGLNCSAESLIMMVRDALCAHDDKVDDFNRPNASSLLQTALDFQSMGCDIEFLATQELSARGYDWLGQPLQAVLA